jgi:hypothetical protein
MKNQSNTSKLKRIFKKLEMKRRIKMMGRGMGKSTANKYFALGGIEQYKFWGRQ